MTCPDCDGCTDDWCRGCDSRWCGGTYMGEGCDRCPNKVPKTITVKKMRNRLPVEVEMEIMVRCNGETGHRGNCHWNPRKVGRDEAT